MNKKDDELYCEYCKNGISLDDKKCPNCGADCTKIINNYAKKKEDEEKEYKDRVLEISENIAKNSGTIFKISSIGSLIIFIVICCFIIFGFMRTFSSVKEQTSGIDSNSIFNEKEDNVINVGFNELAEAKKFDVIIDEYDFYEYSTEHFADDYETPDGYQKIAFHFDIKNNLDEVLTMAFDAKVVLTADDYVVEESDVEACVFCYAISGQDKYNALTKSFVPENSRTDGYIGFLVPVKYKTLKFKIGSSVIITMDNPAYQ